MNPDFRDFFAALAAKGVEYLIIGGVAYNFHAPPRATKDVDVWIQPTRENLQRLSAAVAAFGFPADQIDLDALLAPEGRVVMLGRVPNRIDLLTRPAGLVWETAWRDRVVAKYGDVDVGILSLADLIVAKRAAGRPRDQADAATLEEVRKRGGPDQS